MCTRVSHCHVWDRSALDKFPFARPNRSSGKLLILVPGLGGDGAGVVELSFRLVVFLEGGGR